MLFNTIVLAASLAGAQATSVQPTTPVLDKRLLLGGGAPPSGMNCGSQSGLLNVGLLSSANCNMSGGGFPGASMNCGTQSGGLLNLNLLSGSSCNMASGGGSGMGGGMGGGPPMGGAGFGYGGSPSGFSPYGANVDVSISSEPGSGYWAKSTDHPKNTKHQA